jgi:CubicO group peptidase (beta-lactamase class C family)
MKRAMRSIVGLAVVGLVIVMLPSCAHRRPITDADREVQKLVCGLVERDRSVKNVVLAVEKSDGSFSWAGAAGIAHQDGQVAMIKETPFYIASVTKLYTATVIMRLYEGGYSPRMIQWRSTSPQTRSKALPSTRAGITLAK